jgi:hypothetical protein
VFVGVSAASNNNPDNTKTKNETNQSSINNDFSALSAWASSDHDAIEALAAIGGLIFSVILTGSTVFLWIETRRLAAGAETQSKDMRDSIEQASRAATAMEDSATAMRSFAEAAARTANSSEMGTQAAINAETPILYVESVEVPERREGEYIEAWIRRIHPKITIRNFGKSPAIVDAVIVCLKICVVLPDVPVYQRVTNHPPSYVIGTEPLIHTEYLLQDTDAFNEDSIATYSSAENVDIHVFGRILFRDFMDAKHERGFVFVVSRMVLRPIRMHTVYRNYDYQKRIPYGSDYTQNTIPPTK